MKLRHWQAQCLDAAMKHYQSGHRQFGCLATPGAGKSVFAAVTVKAMLNAGLVDFVLCIAPSVTVRNGLKSTFEKVLEQPMDGFLGSIGLTLTYQGLSSMAPGMIGRLLQQRLIIVLDEIHHCGGHDRHNATYWGASLMALMQHNTPPYTLSLSGTPWRTDENYVTSLLYDQNLRPDMQFSYGLNDAVKEGVCRTPSVHLIDSSKWRVIEPDHTTRTHNSLKQLLKDENLAYQHVLEESLFLSNILHYANERLVTLRQDCSDVGGLIVASSIKHATQIQRMLRDITQQEPWLVTSDTDKSHAVIQQFRNSAAPWLISVGMVSEGTDIPRLQVCCHLSRICTELHFRQVLGRILRKRPKDTHPQATLIVPAHPELSEFAAFLKAEIPEHVSVVWRKKKGDSLITSVSPSDDTLKPDPETRLTSQVTEGSNLTESQSTTNTGATSKALIALTSYGKFEKEVLRFT